MKKTNLKISLCISLCLLVYTVSVSAQSPVAAFSASSVAGCASFNVSFRDQSTGNPVFWNWDFGNGQLSTLQNPSASYNAPGTYTVTLVVRNANGTNGITKTDYITVFPSPNARFTANRTVACLPATIQFQDLSTSPVGTINQWLWNFGDGTSSTEQNPSHSYTSNGFYTISLTVTSSSGCSRNTTAGRYIRIVSGVTAGFGQTIDPTCNAPFNVNFDNQTSGPGNLSYIWRFDDGSSSNEEDPVKSYPAPGNYNVKLVASSDLGCADSLQRSLPINSANVQFDVPTNLCTNNTIRFQNNSTPGALSQVWDFGDGTQSTEANPVKIYSSPGNYTVTLNASYEFCTGSFSQSVNITAPPVINFTSDKTVDCRAPLSASFTSNAPGAVSFAWNFGDGSSSTDQNPVHVYNSPGQYNVSLSTTNNNGCISTINRNNYIRIIPPSLSLLSVAEGCINYVYRPTANANIAVSSLDGISSYTWDWGDGSPVSTGIGATHIYTAEGVYNVSLSILTNNGCTSSNTFNAAVLIGNRPTVDFSVDDTEVCASGQASFTNNSTPRGDRWLWNFGDGTSSVEENPVHSYNGQNTYQVSLTVRNRGCYDSLVRPAYIRVLPPTADFSYTLADCNDPLRYQFASLSDTSSASGSSRYEWDFGSMPFFATAVSDTLLSFPGFGTYPVQLRVYDINGCSDTITKEVIVFQEDLSLSTPDLSICKNQVIALSANVTQPDIIASYQWQINGSAAIAKPASFDTSFAVSGPYSITAIATDINGCLISSTLPLNLTVDGPEVSFSIPSSRACKGGIISFDDLSTSASGIKNLDWAWGDGQTNSYTVSNNPFTHQYNDTGRYNVRLTVTDQENCTASLLYTDTIHITQPQAAFGAANTLFCAGGPLTFTDSSTGVNLTYQWDFGNGNSSTDANPVNIYTGPDSIYSVSLVITDDAGCSDTSQRNNYIEIKSPKPAFTVTDSISICRLLETKFTFQGSDYESFYWDFGDESSSNLQDPTHFYNDYGIYTAKLFLTGYGGCLDSATYRIQVIQPNNSLISYPPPYSACNELLVNFTITTIPSTRFIVGYGDGSRDTSGNTSLQHLYRSPNTYSPVLQLNDQQGCQVNVGGANNIRIIGAEPFFSQDRKAFCDSGRVSFTNFIIGNDPVTSFQWQLEDNVTSTEPNLIYNYTRPGTYITSLTVNTLAGCTKTLTDTVRVYGTPSPVIVSDDVVCINNMLALEGQLAVPDTSISWNWNLGNGQTANLPLTSVIYNTAGDYNISLEAANLLNCKSSTSKTITAAPLPQINIAFNPVIPVRAEVTLPVTYSNNVTSITWTPSSDLSCTDCPNPVASPQFNTSYNVAVIDENGCRSSKDISITIICNELNYFFPNTFSPNGDGNNDVFYPRGKGLNRISSLRIFNRWGELVYEKRDFASNDPSAGWNGTYKGKPANADAYVYIADVICDNAQIIPLKGNVTLIR